ncbi:MAG: O-antigen ligase family protein [Bacteroidota bacterium]
MAESQKLRWIYGISGFFIALTAVFTYLEFYWFLLLPLVLLIVGMALFSLDKLLLLIVFCTPLSVSLEDMQFGLGIILPTEPLMFGVLVIFLIRLWYDQRFDIKILKHPITISMMVNLFWILITSFTSEMPLVSFKFLLSRLWFVVSCYFLATQLFRNPANINRYFAMYLVPLGLVISYTVVRHAMYGFEEKPAHWVMQPFFKDHTSYGALVAMYIPVLVGLLASRRVHLNAKILIGLGIVIYMAGVILSYTRAAWVSLVAALVLFLILYFRVKFRTVLIAGLVAIGCFFAFQDDIFRKLEKNRQDSSSDLTEHVESISNIASDASNLERINRWNSAWRMFQERPVFGWGPGTYMFQYAPFQHSSELTIISTNFGDGGNAHSEYFGPLAEMGVIGLLSMLAIVAAIFYSGLMLYVRLQDYELRLWTLIAVLGLLTYFVHGFLNNFLDTDKASVAVWGFSAIIVAIEVYHRKGSSEKAEGQ